MSLLEITELGCCNLSQGNGEEHVGAAGEGQVSPASL